MKSALSTLGWAIFLGASWTWCIGMYLPALLVRDYGVWAFAIFAAPNVIGAAAMAWVLPNAQASRELVRNHPPACKWFSLITLAFHAFFCAWIIRWLIGGEPWWIAGLAAMALIVALLPAGRRLAALATIIVSAAAACILYNRDSIPQLPIPVAPGLDLLWIGLVCTFGLMLCPYLDLTFHEARQKSPAAKTSFAIGFGIVFFSMILFTLAYSRWMLEPRILISSLVAIPLGIHLLVQTGLKFVLHTRAALMRKDSLTFAGGLLLIIASAFLGSLCRTTTMTYHDLPVGEIAYRCFMSFYGLIFPAYVWICIFGKKTCKLCLAAILIAAPMYWMGFIERELLWLLPGVAIPFLARFLPTPNPRTLEPSNS